MKIASFVMKLYSEIYMKNFFRKYFERKFFSILYKYKILKLNLYDRTGNN